MASEPSAQLPSDKRGKNIKIGVLVSVSHMFKKSRQVVFGGAKPSVDQV